MYFNPVNPDEPWIRRFRHPRAANFKYEPQFQDEDGNPFDFASWTFEMLIKDRKGGTTLVTIPDANFTLATSDDATTEVDIIKIDHPPDDFAELKAAPFEHWFGIYFTDPNSDIYLPIYGDFIILDS